MIEQAKISPAQLKGTIDAPASKSDVHRLLICAALSDRPCLIEQAGTSDDIRATARALEALGAKIETNGGDLLVTPIGQQTAQSPLACGMSGSTLRFLLPVAAALNEKADFIAEGSLNSRPLDDLLQAMEQNGTKASALHTPLSLCGKLRAGTYSIAGNVSSQYISGLLFALPLLDGDSRILLTSPLSSAGYVDMTLDALARFGIRVHKQDDGFLVFGNQTYHAPERIRAEGDWSGAAFFLCAGALQGPVCVRGLQKNSLQRDRRIVDILKDFGAQVTQETDRCTVSGGKLHGITIDIDDIPDLVPPIAVAAACAKGTSRLRGGARLRIKESDRLQSVHDTLQALGIYAAIEGDDLVIHGGQVSHGTGDSFDDHRIAMAFSILASRGDGESTLTRPMAVTKSYPAFYKDYKELGGIIHGIRLR